MDSRGNCDVISSGLVIDGHAEVCWRPIHEVLGGWPRESRVCNDQMNEMCVYM